MTANQKIGIYGGTFDPIHNGHLRVIVELISRKIVDSILLIPAGQPRLRSQAPIATGAERLAMCALAINDLPVGVKERVSVTDIELVREGETYAIDTIEKLEREFPESELFWIIGSDAYEKIDQWHRSAELQDKVSFIVIDRPGSESDDAMDIDALDISATQVRADKGNGTSPSVRKFIAERKLYAGN